MKTKDVFICSNCGAQALKWQGQCPRCGEWNTLQEKVVVRRKGGISHVPAGIQAVSLADIPVEHTEARSTGFKPLDTVLGKGFVPGGAVLLGGEPGIGKSTLLLQLAAAQAQMGNQAVYFSGEESLAQIRGVLNGWAFLIPACWPLRPLMARKLFPCWRGRKSRI